ncbi:hypothetical protein [Methanopyrus sp.]
MTVTGELREGKVLVRNKRQANRLYSSMYGKPSREGLWLWPEEATFLCEVGRLEVKREGERLTLDRLIEAFLREDPRFPVRYAVYADLRQRGWKPKPGRRFGTDFRAFRGEDERIAVKVLHEETDDFTPEDVLRWVRSLRGTEFDLVVAVVDNDFDVNYYAFEELTDSL